MTRSKGTRLVRVEHDAYLKLHQLAHETGKTLGETVAAALEAYRDKRWWDAFNAAAETIAAENLEREEFERDGK